MQNPSLYMLHSFTSSKLCLKGQSSSLHVPDFIHTRHTGMRSGSNLCRKPHESPFMHMPRSQKAHTVCKHGRQGGGSRGVLLVWC